MIVFDGVSLDSAAKVMIEDIRVSPIKMNPVARQRAIRWGSDFVRMGGGERTVAITFALLDIDKVNRWASLDAISRWAKTDKEYKLELPMEPNKYLMAICTSKPEPSFRQWWESKLRLVFTCYDNPYWNSKYEKRFTGSQTTPSTIYIQGDAPPLLRIRRVNSSASSRFYAIDDNTITLSNLPAGELIIDANNQTITVDGVSAMQYYQPSSTFIIPHSGLQTIQGTGYFYYRERWQ